MDMSNNFDMDPEDVIVASVERAAKGAARGAGLSEEDAAAFAEAVADGTNRELLGEIIDAAFWNQARANVAYVPRAGHLNLYAEAKAAADILSDRPAFSLLAAEEWLRDHIACQTIAAQQLEAAAAEASKADADAARAAAKALLAALPNRPDKLLSAVRAGFETEMVAHLRRHRQVNRLDWYMDPFAEATSIRMKAASNTAEIIKPLPALRNVGDVPEADKDIVWKDFTDALPAFPEIIELITASRFASDRKKAFVWLKAPSDFGKGMLTAALADLGLVTECSVKEVEAMMEGRPAGKTPEDFVNAAVLAVNEWKTVKAELKQLEHTITLAPKHQLASSAPVFVKLFLSAEDVPALTGNGAVEDQFCTRFSLVEPAEDAMPTTEQLSFKRLGKDGYRRALAAAIRDAIEAATDEDFLPLGRAGATRKADDALTRFHARHGIGRLGTLSAAIPEIADEFKEWLDRGCRGGELRDFVASWGGERLLVNGDRAFGLFLDETRTPAGRATIARRWADVAKALSTDGKGACKRKRSGEQRRGILIAADPLAAKLDSISTGGLTIKRVREG